jgi:hypothetical protein
MKVNNNVPKINQPETNSLHGDFSDFVTNIGTPAGGEIISSDSASMATNAKVTQDTNTKLLIQSLNGKLEEIKPEPKKQYNPKELGVDK